MCCDVLTDNGPVLVESSVCLKWSHVACYGIAPTAAKKSKFKCKFCINDSFQHLISLSKQLTDLDHKDSTLSSQLSSHIKSMQ